LILVLSCCHTHHLRMDNEVFERIEARNRIAAELCQKFRSRNVEADVKGFSKNECMFPAKLSEEERQESQADALLDVQMSRLLSALKVWDAAAAVRGVKESTPAVADEQTLNHMAERTKELRREVSALIAGAQRQDLEAATPGQALVTDLAVQSTSNTCQVLAGEASAESTFSGSQACSPSLKRASSHSQLSSVQKQCTTPVWYCGISPTASTVSLGASGLTLLDTTGSSPQQNSMMSFASAEKLSLVSQAGASSPLARAASSTDRSCVRLMNLPRSPSDNALPGVCSKADAIMRSLGASLVDSFSPKHRVRHIHRPPGTVSMPKELPMPAVPPIGCGTKQLTPCHVHTRQLSPVVHGWLANAGSTAGAARWQHAQNTAGSASHVATSAMPAVRRTRSAVRLGPPRRQQSRERNGSAANTESPGEQSQSQQILRQLSAKQLTQPSMQAVAKPLASSVVRLSSEPTAHAWRQEQSVQPPSQTSPSLSDQTSIHTLAQTPKELPMEPMARSTVHLMSPSRADGTQRRQTYHAWSCFSSPTSPLTTVEASEDMPLPETSSEDCISALHRRTIWQGTGITSETRALPMGASSADASEYSSSAQAGAEPEATGALDNGLLVIATAAASKALEDSAAIAVAAAVQALTRKSSSCSMGPAGQEALSPIATAFSSESPRCPGSSSDDHLSAPYAQQGISQWRSSQCAGDHMGQRTGLETVHSPRVLQMACWNSEPPRAPANLSAMYAASDAASRYSLAAMCSE